MFPSWMPPAYAVLFSKPFPAFSARMNAWATKMGGTWLMGECDINDVMSDDGTVIVGRQQGLLVKQCRFLQESQCASLCVNSCKIPTQNFFRTEMGLPLTMTPNYDTFECQFAFGVLPTVETELVAMTTPCLMQCPSRGTLRDGHYNNNHDNKSSPSVMITTTANNNNNNNSGDMKNDTTTTIVMTQQLQEQQQQETKQPPQCQLMQD
jgi:Beta-carotene isomerase D27-like, C-terminal